jgi:hypothetical protein
VNRDQKRVGTRQHGAPAVGDGTGGIWHDVQPENGVEPDIIVLDFGCDGETTAQLKGHEQTKHIPVMRLLT